MRPEASEAVRISIAGRFGVERAGHTIGERRLGSRKARQVLKVLAARRGRTVAADDLIEVLWGSEPPAKVQANLATLVSRLRSVLGAGAIAGGRSGYRLDVEAVALDVDEAERLVEQADDHLASGQPALAATAAAAAIELLGAGSAFEEEPGAEWAAEAARQVERLWRAARCASWQALQAIGDHRAALAAARAVVDNDPLDEEAHRTVMRCFHELGEPGEALRSYERLRSVLVEELGADPGPETEAVYLAVLRGQQSPAGEARPSPAAAIPSASSGFVGRDDELQQLLGLWSSATGGASACVVIRGDAGIGKTRLAGELARAVGGSGAIVLQVRCYQAERSLFLQPVVELLRSVAATVPPAVVRQAAADREGPLTALTPELAAVLGPVAYEPAPPEMERRRTFEAIAGLLGALARQRPLLLVVDDLHEAGGSTAELLHFTLRWEPTAPLLVVATARNDVADDLSRTLDPVAVTVEIGGLGPAAVRQLADAAGFADRADAIASLTRGHTLFVVEALRALSEQGEAEEDDRLPIPQSLRDAVVARVRRCGNDIDELLRAGVVVGAAFDVGPVAELLGISGEEVVARAEPARQAGLLVESGAGYEFANDLVHEIVYDTTARPLRILRHRRLATLLADQPEAAGRHAAAAGNMAEAMQHWLDAAERAARLFANREAEQIVSEALDRCGQLTDEALIARAHLARGRARLALGRYGPAGDDLVRAQEAARLAGIDQVEASALTERGWAAYHARDIPAAEDLAERASAHPAAGPRATILAGRIANVRGDLGEAGRLLGSAVDLSAEPRDHALALSCLGTSLAHSDRYAEAFGVLEDAVAHSQRSGALRALLNARMFGAIVLANRGDFGPALAWAEQLVGEAERYDAPFYRPRGLNIAAMIRREVGSPGEARDLAAEALESSTTPEGEVEGEPAANALLGLAESALNDGDEATAAAHLGAIDPLLTDQVGFAWRIELRRLDLACRMDRSRRDELLELSRRYGAVKYEAIALGYLGVEADAVELARQTGSRWLVARVAPEPVARAAADDVASGLPEPLRTSFVAGAPVMVRWSRP